MFTNIVNVASHTGAVVSITGNITGGNLLTGGLISATANVTANNGMFTNIVNVASHTGAVVSITGNITAAGANADIGTTTANSTYNLGTGVTPAGNTKNINIGTAGAANSNTIITIGTALGTGNVTFPANTTVVIANNLTVSGNASSATAAVDTNTTQLATTAYVIAQAAATTPVSIGTNTVGTSTRYARGDHTHTGVASLSNGGGITASASTGAVTLGSTATNANTASAIVARDASGNFSAGTITATLSGAATTAGTVTTAAQGNITSVGTLTGLAINNATTAITNSAGNGVGNIGTSAASFNIIFAKSTSAQYADLAEKYLADQTYEVGTVLAVGGDAEVTACKIGDKAIGAVSENPAFKMNDGLENGTYVALKGRVPVRVIGTVLKGQRLVAHDNGCAIIRPAEALYQSGDVFAMALESSDNPDIKLIESIIL